MRISPLGVRRGDIYEVGRHRIACGYNSDRALVAALLDDWQPDLLFTDPPYCSGGMQDAAKKTGSNAPVRGGLKGYVPMCGDTLSARGYSTMMAAMMAAMDLACAPPALYIFTDWRMWSTLEDVIAVRGYGVRNMLVWDKGFIGPGNGFRAQHELIMVGTNRGNLWPNGKGTVAYGHSNVLHHSRAVPTAKRHPSQKPLSLLLEILTGSEFAQQIYDPFTGSASTAIAAEELERSCRGIEVSPEYAEAALGQLQRALLTPARLLGNVYA